MGYIYITSFNEQSTADLQKAVKDLKRQIGPKLKGYIIDLRNDPGGLLDQAIGVADAFLDQGTIVITKGREEMQRSEASPGDITDGKKLVVLINGGSASAAEIVAGALQDHHRATLGRHPILRQGLGANYYPAWFQRRANADNRSLLHAFREIHSGEGHRA